MDVPARIGHIAVCVDRYLLVWGGYQDDETEYVDRYLTPEELWIYNTETKLWQMVKLSQALLDYQEYFPRGTSGASADFLNGYLYIFGGHTVNGNNNYVLKLDLRTFKWDVIMNVDADRPLPSPRDKFVSWTFKNSLYYFGGFGKPLYGYLQEHGDFVADESTMLSPRMIRGWNNQLLTFDTDSWEWSNPKCKGVTPLPRAAHAAARVGDKVYVFGGRHKTRRMADLHCLDLPSLTWSGEIRPVGEKPCGRSWHSMTAVTDTWIFLYGGYTQDNTPLADAWVLDVRAVLWMQIRLPEERPRLWHTSCLSPDGDILIFGGCANNILSTEEKSMHCNDVLEFRLSPKTLLRLSIDAAFTHRHVCEKSWNFLPKHLMRILNARRQGSDQRDGQEKSEQATPSNNNNGDSSQNRGQTCVIS